MPSAFTAALRPHAPSVAPFVSRKAHPLSYPITRSPRSNSRAPSAWSSWRGADRPAAGTLLQGDQDRKAAAGGVEPVPPAALDDICSVGGGGGNRTHVRKPSAAGVYADSRPIVRLARPAPVRPTGRLRGQPHCSRPSPETRFRASHQNMTSVPEP